MQAAQAGLRTRLVGLEPGQQLLVMKALAGRPGWQADYEQRYPCPVCVQDGWLVCWLILDGDDQPVDALATDPTGTAMRRAVAHVHGFSCSACDLRLDDAAEVAAAGLPLDFDLGPRRVDLEIRRLVGH
jgi:hypothetical protein